MIKIRHWDGGVKLNLANWKYNISCISLAGKYLIENGDILIYPHWCWLSFSHDIVINIDLDSYPILALAVVK